MGVGVGSKELKEGWVCPQPSVPVRLHHGLGRRHPAVVVVKEKQGGGEGTAEAGTGSDGQLWWDAPFMCEGSTSFRGHLDAQGFHWLSE